MCNFFFQAEDGIRDVAVTGVQTCALPILAAIPGHARIRSTNQPISWFVRMLTGQLQGPVIDATALTGKYDFQVSWAYEENANAPPNPYRSALIQAVQSQLGLKLEQKKGEAEVLIVDRIQKTPTEN